MTLNVYLFELKLQWKSAAAWTAALLIVLFALITAIYPVYYDSRSTVQSVIDGFPPAFASAFGLDVENVFSFGGFNAFCFLYLSLMGGIMASSLGLAIFSREKRNKSADFLFTKPISRLSLFFAKILASLTLILASNSLYIALSLFLYRRSVQDEFSLKNGMIAASSLLFIQLIFLAISIFIAVTIKKARSVSGAATALGFSGFILSALHSIMDDESLRYIAPYKYFDIAMAYSSGRYEPQYVITAAIIFVSLIAASCFIYCRHDVYAV